MLHNILYKQITHDLYEYMRCNGLVDFTQGEGLDIICNYDELKEHCDKVKDNESCLISNIINKDITLYRFYK